MVSFMSPAPLHEPTLAALFVLAMWWLSTGIVLRLVWRPSAARVALASALGGVGFTALWWSAYVQAIGAAYVGFVSALAVWGWHELMFLLGLVTGPRKSACPPDARGFERFRLATSTVIHHEVALTVTLAAVVAVTWGAPNQVGTWTYGVLWVMRLSAKLNVFFGVRNLSVQLMPERLRYLVSYFRTSRMSWLMPVSVIAASGVLVHLIIAVRGAAATPLFQVERTLVATILALAVLEHLFLALPVPDAALFRWATRKR